MNWARVFFGSVIAAVGAVLFMDYAGWVTAGEIFGTWWPLLLIAAGVMTYLAHPHHWVMPTLITGLGTAFLLQTTGVIESIDVVAPLALIFLGIAVIAGRGWGTRTTASADSISSFNAFSGSEIASHSAQFRGGNVGAVFGGTEIDLRDARPAPGAELDVFVAFGGAEVRVPEGWEVTTKGIPIFGGFENVTTKERLPAGSPHLDINATVLFGGLEVKH